MYRFLNAVGEDSVDCPRDDCWGMNPCCVVFTPNQLNIITFHFSGLNLLYLACITNDRKAQANTDVFFFFPTLILAYEPWKWKIKTAVLMELSWLWCSLFQMWLNPICIHDITRRRCVLPFSSFIEKTENLCFKIYLIYKIHLYNSTNDVEQKAMWNIQPSHIQCVTSRQIKGERSCYMYIYFHPPFSSIANTCMGTRILVRLLLGCLRFILTVCTDTVQCHGSTPTPIKIPKSPSLGTNWELIPPIRSTPLHFLCLLRADDVFLGLDI